MKKIVTNTIFCIMVLLMFQQNAVLYAADTVKVSAAYETIEQLDDKNYIIPVYIVGNPGIMGFRINIKYDSNCILIHSVSRGKITSEGNFNTSANHDEENGFISVLWNATENISGDGTLMYLCVSMIDSSAETLNMDITFSQEDTFNEAWEDVFLDCYGIRFPVKKSVDSDKNSDDLHQESGDLKEDLTNEGDNDIEEVTCKDYVADTVPDEVMHAEEEKTYLDDAKKEVRSLSAASDIGEETIKKVLARKMKQYGISSVDELNEEQTEEFWNSVGDDLIDIEGVDEEIIKDIDVSKLAENVTVSDEEIQNADLSVKPAKKASVKRFYVYLGIGAALMIIAVSVVFIRMKRRKD